MLAATLLLCQLFDQPPLQPYEVRSASGEWTLEVRPTDPRGVGPMRARILQGSEPRWAGELGWTFEQAGIADDGTSVGYGNAGKLRVAVLAADGSLRRLHEFEHTGSVLHGPKLPNAGGPVLVHPSGDLALVQVQPADQARPFPWWTFRLSTGEASAAVVPAPPLPLAEDQGLYAGEARAIGDSGLTLVRWWFADYDAVDLDWPQEGAVFALHDLAGRVVWSLALLDDYTDRTSEEADDRLAAEHRWAELIESVPGDRFALRHVRTNERVEYELERDASGAWTVRERGRSPWSPPGPTAPPAPEPITLVRKALIPLRTSPPPSHPVHDVFALGFTEAGELELFRLEPERLSYARISPDGELLFERDLTAVVSRENSMPRFHDLVGDRWLVQFLSGEPAWLVLDVRTGATSPAPLPEAGLGSHVAALADGGYLALLSRVVRSTALTELHHVRADGTTAWEHRVIGSGPDDSDFDRAVYSANGIARTGDGVFTLLSTRDLTRIDLERNVLATWKLEEVLGKRPGYMDGLIADGQGGVLFEVADAFQRVDRHGVRTATFVPRRPDGSREGRMDHLLGVAPDGRLWTSDDQRVYRLDEAGVADLVLGPEAREDELVEVHRAAIDSLGRVLVQERTSRAVHVFDADGRRLALCRLAPAERSDGYGSRPFWAEPDGSLRVKTSAGVIAFDAKGERMSFATEDHGQSGRASETIRARPDGTWLANVKQRALLADGRQVILEGPTQQGQDSSLHLYAADGDPLRTIPVPADVGYFQLTSGRRWIVLGDFGPSWILIRLEDERLFRFESELPGEWTIGQTPDGDTLLLFDQRRLELLQLELP